jgi:FixJ family two-component response regulator
MVKHGALVAIVDDEASIRKALLRLFRLARYQAEAFDSASGLLMSMADHSPSCVVLDLQLPGMTGVELLERFAELDDPPPVVVITSNDEQRVEDQCLALGTKRYFRKPIDCDALLDAVRDIVAPAA